MSKKKASTMTLRDFHGGNIPSELPLPSAPGMVVERKNHDRPGSGGWMGSSLHRGYSGERAGFSRQGSGNFARSYEEKMSYLPNPANIGRNYDEDERKPVDGPSHKGQSPDLFEEAVYEQRQLGHERPSEKYVLDNRGVTRERYSVEELSPAPVSSSMARMDGVPRRASMYQDSLSQPFVSQEHSGHHSHHVPPRSPYHAQEPGPPWRQSSLGQQPLTPGTLMGSGTGVQNVWTARKDVEYARSYPTEYIVNETAPVHTSGSRIVQASALEKVSSGKWNSRMPQSPNESQGYVGDYGQSYGGAYEGGNLYPVHDSTRFPADYDRALYPDRSYVEPVRGVESQSLRDRRLSLDKGNLQDSRRELISEGKGTFFPELYQYVDDRHAYGEMGQKGNASQREGARFVGSRDGAQPELGQLRLTNNRFNTNEAVSYSEPRSAVQGNPGLLRPEHSSRREYGEEVPIDANKGMTSDLEKRGFSRRESAMDRDSFSQRSRASESSKERSLCVDSPFHGSGKDDIGYSNSPHPKIWDDFSQEAPDRSGRLHDRNRGLDIDQNHPVHLGGLHTSSYDSGGAASSSMPVDEGKGAPVERPKLKLLPRTKPLQVDSQEDVVPEIPQEHYELLVLSQAEGAPGSGSGTSTLLASAESEDNVRTVERPKLSLKPRSQPVDFSPAGSGSVKERMSLFGGARPREMVLKERGVDESVIVGTDLTFSPSPSPVSGVRTPTEGNRTTPGGLSYSIEKPEKLDERSRRIEQHETRNGRQDSGRLDRLDSRGRKEHTDFDKKDDRRGSEHRHHLEKRESERLDVDKQESWRRPVEGPQSPLPGGEVSSVGAGRPMQSAAELAQAFSRSTSFGSGPGASPQGYASQRSPGLQMPGLISGMGAATPELPKTDIPFSRLTEAVSPGPPDFHVSGVQAGYRRTSAF